MRIAYLGDPNNIHTRRWVGYFAQKHTCALFCDPPVLRPIQGVEIICPPMGVLRKVLAFKLVRHRYSNNYFKAAPYKEFVSHWKPDVVHGFEALAFGFSTAACRRYPTILTPWGNDILDWPRKSMFARYLVKKALRGVDVISTNAPGLEQFLEREYKIDPHKVDCFSWGIDLEIFHPEITDEARLLAKRYNISETARVILSPRKMKPYWGIGTIAEAVPELVRRLGPNTVVVFLRAGGDPAYEAQLHEQIELAGYAANVRFVPEKMKPGEMAAWFNRANLFISMPETDLLSLTVLEGMGCGSVPILADLPAYHTRVNEEENGFYMAERSAAALVDAVEKALSDRERLKAIATRNIELIQENDDSRHASARMEALYRQVISNK